jgi:hypothetical protein
MREPSRLRKVVADEQLPDNSLLDFDVSLLNRSEPESCNGERDEGRARSNEEQKQTNRLD